MVEYTFHQFSEDLDEFLNLYRQIFGNTGSPDWFDWKYRTNPYIDRIPIFVAKADDKLVGARPFFVLELTDGTKTWNAIQPCDTMVHPDHRGQGIFTKMTETALAYYEDQPIDLVFNFPNNMSRPGYLKMGWQEVQKIPEYYRFNDLQTTVREKVDSSTIQTLASVACSGVNLYNSVRDFSTPDSPDTIEISIVDRVPTETLLSLHERSPSSGLHATRDRQFYNWRYENPERQYRTIVGKQDDKAVAAAIVGASSEGDFTEARITEIVSLPDTEQGVIPALMNKILDEYKYTDLLALFDKTIPNPARWGFISDQRFPISKVQQSTYLLTRPVNLANTWNVNNHENTEPSNWSLSYVEWDTS